MQLLRTSPALHQYRGFDRQRFGARVKERGQRFGKDAAVVVGLGPRVRLLECGAQAFCIYVSVDLRGRNA